MHELPLDRKRLQALAAKARHYDIAPLFLPSYVGGKHPIAPLLTELVAEARGHISALSADEAWSLVDSLPFGLSTMIDGQPGSDSGPLSTGSPPTASWPQSITATTRWRASFTRT